MPVEPALPQTAASASLPMLLMWRAGKQIASDFHVHFLTCPHFCIHSVNINEVCVSSFTVRASQTWSYPESSSLPDSGFSVLFCAAYHSQYRPDLLVLISLYSDLGCLQNVLARVWLLSIQKQRRVRSSAYAAFFGYSSQHFWTMTCVTGLHGFFLG